MTVYEDTMPMSMHERTVPTYRAYNVSDWLDEKDEDLLYAGRQGRSTVEQQTRMQDCAYTRGQCRTSSSDVRGKCCT